MAVKTVLTITDMACSMCEAHVNDAIRKAFGASCGVKKVKSSHRKNRTEILSDAPIPEEEIRKVIGETGYTLTEIES